MIRLKPVVIGLACLLAGAASAAPCEEALGALRQVAVDAAAAEGAERALQAELKTINPLWTPGYCRALAENLARKTLSKQEGVAFDANLLERTAIRYESFRVETFRNSGVAPKLYFGFSDQKGATAAYETELLRVSAKVAPILNAYAGERGLSIRVTPKEIAVTQIAEGGALLLTTHFSEIEHIHPVKGVGLDDYRIGFVRYPGLVERIDAAFGSKLGGMGDVQRDSMSFSESALGTAVMYFYEKDLAEQKLRAENRPSLAGLPLDEQFVTASLVYNSGILFSAERVQHILRFDTAAYLADMSERSAPKRPRFPVMTPEAADAWLAQGKAPPDQPTSWNAVYHVLQRYGAWVALSRFSQVFGEDGGVRAKL